MWMQRMGWWCYFLPGSLAHRSCHSRCTTPPGLLLSTSIYTTIQVPTSCCCPSPSTPPSRYLLADVVRSIYTTIRVPASCCSLPPSIPSFCIHFSLGQVHLWTGDSHVHNDLRVGTKTWQGAEELCPLGEHPASLWLWKVSVMIWELFCNLGGGKIKAKQTNKKLMMKLLSLHRPMFPELTSVCLHCQITAICPDLWINKCHWNTVWFLIFLDCVLFFE